MEHHGFPHRAGPVLTIRGLVLGFDGRELLEIEHLEVAESEVVALVGVSGIGKTTLLTCLTGDMEPIRGTYSVRPRDHRDARGHAVRTLQSFPLLNWRTVGENLNLSAKVQGIREISIDETLARFSALPLRHRYPESLSGGERCRASLCQALVSSPDLLLLDEPFNGLDFLVKTDIASHLFEWARVNRAAVLYVTHDLYDAATMADRVVVLSKGSPAKVFADFDSDGVNTVEKIKRILMEANQ